MNAAFTGERYTSAFSPFKTICCVSRVLPSASPANRHSNDGAAPSKLISIVAALGGVTSRMNSVAAPAPQPRDPTRPGGERSV